MWVPDITIWQRYVYVSPDFIQLEVSFLKKSCIRCCSADPLTPFFSKEQDICQIFSSGDVTWAPKARMTVYSNMTLNENGDTQHSVKAYLGSWMLGIPQIDLQASSSEIGASNGLNLV